MEKENRWRLAFKVGTFLSSVLPSAANCQYLTFSEVCWLRIFCTNQTIQVQFHSTLLQSPLIFSILMTYNYTFIGTRLELECDWTIFFVVVSSQLKFPRMSMPCHGSFQSAWLTCHNIIFSHLAHIKIFSHLAHIKLFSH